MSSDGSRSPSPPPRPKQSGKPRRGGVSAEVYNEESAKKYVKKVIPKDEATRVELQNAIAKNVLFKNLDSDEKRDIFDVMFPMEFKDGDYIIRQGDDGDNFYVLDSGTVSVIINDNTVADVNAPGSFGELALIYGQPRAASIRAKGDCKCWVIDRESYRHILMSSTMKKREQYNAFLEKVPLLENLDEYERLTLADAMEAVTYDDGECVVKQDEEGDDFFIVRCGKAIVLKTAEGSKEPRQEAELGEGAYFGEVALIKRCPRTATVKAVGELRCLKLDRPRFERLLGSHSDIMQRRMQKY